MDLNRMICLFATLVGCITSANLSAQNAADPTLVEVKVISSIDGTEQLSRLCFPKSSEAKPLLIFLHSWSHGVAQDNTRWLELATQRGWAFLQPDFRGKNNRPEACGSELARQDILDAVKYLLTQTEIDRSRIYLAGTSGGGHMAMLMASYYPDKFSAVSSWVGISDLHKWHTTTRLKTETEHYSKELENCIGGPPSSSDAISYQLKMRSPIHHLAKAANVPLDINTGVRDGHTGSVPVSQSIDAFNVILRVHQKPEIPFEEIKNWTDAGASEKTYTEVIDDASYPRKVLFRSQVNQSRLTIFEGAHEDLPTAGIAFLEAIQRETEW